MTKLWLIRHGQTDWNLAGRWQGQTSDAPPLNETGRAQALAIREKLADSNFAAVYSSDLLRAKQTAEIIATPLGSPVVLDARLREMNLGAWEGMLSEDIAAQYPRELEERKRDPLHARAPQGESPADVAARVFSVMDEITSQHPNETVVIVAHGIALAIIICQSQNIPLNNAYEYIPENAKPYYAEWR